VQVGATKSIDLKYRSTNEGLTALNSQLQETLERQRTTSDDLQNILYSIDVATLFLDTDLNIRFFTPATQSLFNFSPGDVGQPVASFQLLDLDDTLLLDARTVLKAITPISERSKEGTEAGTSVGCCLTVPKIAESKALSLRLRTSPNESASSAL
jgi:PAS domain-containing protein